MMNNKCKLDFKDAPDEYIQYIIKVCKTHITNICSMCERSESVYSEYQCRYVGPNDENCPYHKQYLEGLKICQEAIDIEHERAKQKDDK